MPDSPNVKTDVRELTQTHRAQFSRVLAMKDYTPSFQEPGKRSLFVKEFVEQRAHSRKKISSKASYESIARCTVFNISEDMNSVNSEVARKAYLKFRAAIGPKILLALRNGCEWMDLLNAYLERFTQSAGLSEAKRGHDRLKGYFHTALIDVRAHQHPLLHAEALFVKMDDSWCQGYIDSNRAKWDAIESRPAGLDCPSLAERIVEAFIQMKDNPSLDDQNVWHNPGYRRDICNRYHKCLMADEQDSDRGRHLANVLTTYWEEKEAEVNANEANAASLDIRMITSRKIVPAQNSWSIAHDSKSQRTHKSRIAANSSYAIPRTTPAESERTQPTAEPRRVLGTSSDNPSKSDNGASKAARRKQRIAAGAVARATAPVGSEAPPDSHQTSTVIPPPPLPSPPPVAVGAALPDPPPLAKTSTGSTREYFPHPTGSTGNPRKTEWTRSAWHDTRVSWARMAMCKMSDGRPTTAYKAVARAFPTNANLQDPMLFSNYKGPDKKNDVWPNDACAFCRYRSLMPPNAPPETGWLYGTGNGAHSPQRCLALRRFLAEGGDTSNTATEKAFLQSCLEAVDSNQRR